MSALQAETYDIRGFMREAGIMSDFRHPNVVQLIAACDNRQPFRPPQSPSPPPQSQHSPKSPAVRTGNTTSGGGATANAAAGSGGGGSGAAAAAVPHDAASSARFAIILEFIPGGSLRDYVSERHSTLSMSERIGLLVQCAEPLSEMHAVEIVHRDIKPDNIMLTTDKPPHVKLCDFGLARYVSPGDAIVSTVRPNAGTPHFMAPEQAAGDPLTPAIDAYAFGGLIFFMLYGKQPWIDRHSMQILMALIRKEKPPVPSGVVLPPQVASPSAAAATATATTRVDSKINASAPTATADSFQSALFLNLEHLMRRCYEYEPKARPTMREIVDELRDLYDLSLNPNPLPVMSASVAAAAPTPNAAVILTLPVATATVVTPIARSTAPAVYASAAVIAPPAAATPAVYNPYAYNPHASASAVTVVVVTPSAEANSLYPASIGVEGQPDEYPPAVFDHHSS